MAGFRLIAVFLNRSTARRRVLVFAAGMAVGLLLSTFLCSRHICSNCREHPHARTLHSAEPVDLHQSPNNATLPGWPWRVRIPAKGETKGPFFEPWEYFDGWDIIYNGVREYPTYRVSRDRTGLSLQELAHVEEEVLHAVRRKYQMDLSIYSIVNAYIRRNPFVGNEYIYDVEFSEKHLLPQPPILWTRVTVTQRFEPTVTLSVSIPKERVVNFVVPFSSHVGARLKEFMQAYEREFLSQKERVRLLIAVFGRKSGEFARNELKRYQARYPEARMDVVEGSGTFQRGKARHFGTSFLKDEDLIFLCDVDIEVKRDFLTRCRHNAIKGQRVYFPEVFKMYNMEYVYRGNTKLPGDIYQVNRSHGHWGYYGYGMVCIYGVDYSAVGGMSTVITGWGGEDVDFFYRTIKIHEVVQAPDPALYHRWHSKSCPAQSLSWQQHSDCLGSKYESLADRKDLGRLLYDIAINRKSHKELYV